MKPSRVLLLAIGTLVLLVLAAQRGSLSRARSGQNAAPAAVVPDNPCYDSVSVAPQLAPAQTAAPDPPDTIDGAKNPELIPDDVAYRLIFLAIAEPEDAPPERLALARDKIAPTGLSENDTQAFLLLLTGFRKQFDALNAQEDGIFKRNFAVHPLSTDAEQLRTLRTRRLQLIADTIAALPARLSDEGFAKLQEHVQREKRSMKMCPSSYENGKPVY